MEYLEFERILSAKRIGRELAERFCSRQWNILQWTHERDKENHRKGIQPIE